MTVMAVTQVGTVDWFKREKRNLIELAKAVDSFATAARKVQKIIELGSAADAALHNNPLLHKK